MSKIASITLAAALAAAFVVPGAADAKSKKVITGCEGIGKTARVVMRARQEEVPMSEVLQWMNREIPAGVTRDITRTIINAAYDSPGWRAESNKAHAVASFGNTFERACYKKNG